MKYIPADKLIAEIQRRKKQDTTIRERSILIDIETAIASLQQEQPEVDLEKEIEKCLKQYHMLAVGRKEFIEIAHRFVEWGAIHFNARKK